MPALRDLQTRMLDALLGASVHEAVPLIDAPAAGAVCGLDVYRNNIQANFEAALRSAYPVTGRLVGAAYFRQTVRRFHGRHPSRSGDLQDAGAAFAGFLADLHGSGEFCYLADVARLEWSIQEALQSPDHAALDLERLAHVHPSEYEDLHFGLHPTLRLFESRFPVLEIWEANTGTAEPQIIDLGAGGERGLVMRRQSQLRLHRLDPGEHVFLSALERGVAFGAAIAAAAAQDAGFEATAALRHGVAIEAIVDCRSRHNQNEGIIA